jgi:hypothetical protein
MASFIGNDFTLEAVCAVTGVEKNELLKLMDKLFKEARTFFNNYNFYRR